MLTLYVAFIGLAALVAAPFLRRPVDRSRWHESARCPRCGHPLTDLASSAPCPECGLTGPERHGLIRLRRSERRPALIGILAGGLGTMLIALGILTTDGAWLRPLAAAPFVIPVHLIVMVLPWYLWRRPIAAAVVSLAALSTLALGEIVVFWIMIQHPDGQVGLGLLVLPFPALGFSGIGALIGAGAARLLP